jgi:hypothetical protein
VPLPFLAIVSYLPNAHLDVLDLNSCSDSSARARADVSHYNGTLNRRHTRGMLEPFDDQKKRPPPIAIPVLPRHAFGYATQPNVQQQQQQQQQFSTRNASSSTQQGPRSATSPRTSPSDPDIPRVPHSGSQKSRTSAMTALSSMMDQTRGSPRRSEHGSTMGKSTAQSRHSERSQHSATAAQAQLEALDEDDRTSRAKIESRGEKSLFKMTGQVPPTPIVGEYYIIRYRNMPAS